MNVTISRFAVRTNVAIKSFRIILKERSLSAEHSSVLNIAFLLRSEKNITHRCSKWESYDCSESSKALIFIEMTSFIIKCVALESRPLRWT